MCSECRQHPHHPACPNAPQPDYIKPCILCGRELDEEELFCGICENCLSSQYNFVRGRLFADISPKALAQSIFSIRLDGEESCVDEAARVLLDWFCCSDEYDPEFREEEFRRHALEDNRGDWAEFLRGLERKGAL